MFLTYVFNRRTHSVDVRDSATYVFETTLLENEIRDYAFGDFGTTHSEIEDSGQRIWRWIRDYAVEIEDSGQRFWSDGFGTTQSKIEDSGLRRTFWTLDLMQKIAVDLFSGLSIASKIMIDTLYI